ncbi:hypothetical protein M8C21_007283, partial [Ambrosia artemisiifolia]
YYSFTQNFQYLLGLCTSTTFQCTIVALHCTVLRERPCLQLNELEVHQRALMWKSIVMAASKGRSILIVPLPKAAKKTTGPGRGGRQTRATANVVLPPPDPVQEEPVNPLLPLP